MARPKLSSSVKKSSQDVPKTKCQSKFRQQKVKVATLLTGEGIFQMPSDQLPVSSILLRLKTTMPEDVRIKISEARRQSGNKLSVQKTEYFEEDLPLKLEFENEDAGDEDEIKSNWIDDYLAIDYDEEKRLSLEYFKETLRSRLEDCRKNGVPASRRSR